MSVINEVENRAKKKRLILDLICYSMSSCSFEILHARWAMLAAIGALVPEILDLLGTFHFVEPVWWRVGYSKLKVSLFLSLQIK